MKVSQEYREKVVPYLVPGTAEQEEVRGIKYQIRNTRQEEAFRQFQDPSSPQSMLCDITSDDNLMRLFLFLKPQVSFQPVEEYPLILTYPLFLDFDEKFLGYIFDEPTKKKIEDMKERSDGVVKSVKDISSKLMWKFFTAAVSDRQVSARLQRRGGRVKEQEIEDLISGLVNRRKHEFENIMKDWINVFGSMYQAQEYFLPIIQAYERLKAAKENLDTLSGSLIVLNLPEALRNSLSKLISNRIFRMKLDSICLECNLRKGLEPYTMIQKYPSEPILDNSCNKCGGKSVYHDIKMEAKHSFGPLFQENTLQEFIVAYTLARSDIIRKLYVHKKISILREKGPTPGVQVNIFAITTDDKILIIEVTTSRNLNKVMQDVDAKISALRDFPYEKLVFITPLEVKDYLDYHDGKIRIFGSRHLEKIVSHIGYLVKGA